MSFPDSKLTRSIRATTQIPVSSTHSTLRDNSDQYLLRHTGTPLVPRDIFHRSTYMQVNATNTVSLAAPVPSPLYVSAVTITSGLFRHQLPTVQARFLILFINRLTPNAPYMGLTTPLNSKRCILYIYSTNTGTEYFKHALYSPFSSLQNAVCFIMLTCLVPVLFTFYVQGVLKIKK